jgi:hypothetical protein
MKQEAAMAHRYDDDFDERRDLHIPDLVDQTELDHLKPLRGVPETAD